MENLNLIYPEIFLSLLTIGLLMLGVFKENSFNLIIRFSSIGLLLLIPVVYINNDISNELFSQNYLVDSFSIFMKILILGSSAIALFFTNEYIKNSSINQFEYPILVLTSILGMFVMVSSNNLMGLYLGIELQSLSLYVLASLNRDSIKSTEAGVKYFVLGALSSGLLLYGCSLIYGFTGSTNYYIIAKSLDANNLALTFGMVFILVGLAFKISAVPFHMWAPDVYEGSPTTVTLFFTMVPKIAALTVFIRFLYVPFLELIDQWQMILVFSSIASMLFGAIAAIGQKNIKRLIAYSSIGHIGYALAGIASASNDGIQSSVIYLTIYIVVNLGFFSCLLMLRRNDNYYESIDDLSGLSKNHPILSFSFFISWNTTSCRFFC